MAILLRTSVGQATRGVNPTQDAGVAQRESVAEAGASDESKVLAEWQYVAAGFAFVLVGILAGTWISQAVKPEPFKPAEGVGIFAVFYIFAQALERMVEPIAGHIPEKPKALKERDQAIAEAKNDPTLARLQNAANKQENVNQVRANLAVLTWGATSLLAMLGIGYLGVYLLRAVGVSSAPVWLDVALSGMAVGGGTKPLHDLIKNIEKSKEEKEDRSVT